MKHIYKCENCNTYTLKLSCPYCGSPTKNPKPGKFSPEDKFGGYRRKAKKLSVQK